MSRTPDQTMRCLRRDLDWLATIKKRARDNEVRTPAVHAEMLRCLSTVMAQFQRELDEDAAAVLRIRQRQKQAG